MAQVAAPLPANDADRRAVREQRHATRLRVWSVALLALGLACAAAWAVAAFGTEHKASVTAPLYLLPLFAASAVSIGPRFVRWQYLLRRADVRVPARPSFTIYLASLIGVATPGHVGEVVRCVQLRRRFAVPLRISVAVLLVERWFDAVLLGLLGVVSVSSPELRALLALFLVLIVLAGVPLAAVGGALGVPARLFRRMVSPGALLKSLALSAMVWAPVACTVAMATRAVGAPVGLVDGAGVFAVSTLAGGLSLLPAGVVTTGTTAISELTDLGLTMSAAVLAVTLVRVATVGLWLGVAGVVGLRQLLRGGAADEPAPATAAEHFDAVAGEYDEQFSEHVWNHLLARKMDMVAAAVGDRGRTAAAPGLDLGCGLGRQVRAMGERGYHVTGIDASTGLVARARADGVPVLAGSALALPFGDATFDFVYVVGVLHHLPDTATQEAACREIVRVLRPGGRLVVHETNPNNPLFSLYMGYVFPLLKTIDEGTEWWIEPRRWSGVEGLRHVETRWFTFLPDFIPRVLMPPFRLLERALERSPLRRWSVHYMAVLEKP